MKIAALIIIVLIYSIIGTGCKDNSAAPDDRFSLKSAIGNNLYGMWVETGYEDDHQVFRRVENLETDNYGFIIFESGRFLERKNSGWCGTPPIVYGNFEGTWLPETDNLIDISVGYWGGTTRYKLEIVSVNENELRVRYLYESQ